MRPDGHRGRGGDGGTSDSAGKSSAPGIIWISGYSGIAFIFACFKVKSYSIQFVKLLITATVSKGFPGHMVYTPLTAALQRTGRSSLHHGGGDQAKGWLGGDQEKGWLGGEQEKGWLGGEQEKGWLGVLL